MISVGNNKAVICKGDFHPAQLYKGDKKIAGYSLEEFTGTDNVTIENCYNDNIYDVQIHGKNLFNSKQLLQAEGWVENNGEYSGKIGSLWGIFKRYGSFDVPIPLGTPQICISFEGKNATKNASTFSFQIYYTDGTSTLWVGVVNSIEWTEYKLKSVYGKTVKSIECGYNDSDTIYLRNIQITATEDYETYEPFLLDATITAMGKNLFNIQSTKNLYNGQYGRYSRTEKGFKVVCNQSSNAFRMNVLIPRESFKEGKKYSISCNGVNIRMIRVGEANDLNDTSTCFKYGGGNGKSCSITISTITKPYINIYFYGSTYNIEDIIIVENIQIEESAEVTTYQPYIEPQTILFENGNLMADIPTFKGTTVIEVESDVPATISGKYKKVEV